MTFNSVTIIKAPQETVFQTLRDELPHIASRLDDISAVTLQHREDRGDEVEVVSLWEAAPQLPSLIAGRIPAGALSWIDTATWISSQQQCRWEIVPGYFEGAVVCRGETRFEAAMGGRGTRLTFSGDIQTGDLRHINGLLTGPVLKGVQAIVSQLIPANFRKLAKALEAHVQR